MSAQYALSVRKYQEARERYRRYSSKTRPAWVAEAYESAKRQLGKARGEPNCPSPHLQTDPKRCASCFSGHCYRKATIIA